MRNWSEAKCHKRSRCFEPVSPGLSSSLSHPQASRPPFYSITPFSLPRSPRSIDCGAHRQPSCSFQRLPKRFPRPAAFVPSISLIKSDRVGPKLLSPIGRLGDGIFAKLSLLHKRPRESERATPEPARGTARADGQKNCDTAECRRQRAVLINKVLS